MRRTPSGDARPQDEPGFNRLHHVCLLWVDYLRAADEAEKQALLREAAGHLTMCYLSGAEGEEVVKQVWDAIYRRPHHRVYVHPDSGTEYAEAMEGGQFGLFRALTDTTRPIQEGIWVSAKGSRVEVCRLKDHGDLLCVWANNIGLAAAGVRASAEAARFDDGYLPCDSDTIRGMGPWSYVGPST